MIDISTQIDWFDFYSQYLELKKAGRNEAAALCPFHNDRNPSLFINLETGIWHCFGCEEKGNAVTFLQKMGVAKDTKEAYKVLLDFAGLDPESVKESYKYTIDDYANEKGLPKEFLVGLGITSGGDCINIPYFDENHNLVATRHRYAPFAKRRFTWDPKSRLIPYGLWKLEEIKQKGYVIFVEGESDAQTLWYNGISAVGIPGATTFKEQWADYFLDLNEIYIFCEPDEGGSVFLRKIGETFAKKQYKGKIKVLRLTDYKDISDLYVSSTNPTEFAETFNEALETAEPINLDVIVNEPDIKLSNAPIQLRSPIGWAETDEGIFKYSPKNDEWERICKTPILFTKDILTTDRNEEKIEMAVNCKGKWKTMIVEKPSVFDHRELTTYSKYGVAVGSRNAKDLADFLLGLYEANMDLLQTVLSTSQLGWVDNNHFIPGAEGDIILDLDPGSQQLANAYETSGDLEDWINLVSPHRKNPVFRFMLSSSFAAPLLRILSHRIFIVHNWGNSKSGKTAALKAALSVWGDPVSLITTFNSTKVGLEKMAALFNDLPLGVDEKQVVGKKQDFIEQLVYMLSLGTSKTRGTRTGGMQIKRTWRSIIITTGEEPLTEDSSNEGVYTRTLEIYGRPFTSELEAERMHMELENVYGTAGPEFIRKLIEIRKNNEEFPKTLFREIKNTLLKKFLGNKMEPHISAVALVATADILASQLIFQEKEEVAVKEALEMAEAVAEALVDTEEADTVLQAYEFVKAWLEANKAMFTTAGSTATLVKENYGVYDPSENVYYVYPYKIKGILEDQGFSYKKVIKGWVENNLIKTESTTARGKKYTTELVRKRINNSQVRMIGFIVKNDLLSEDQNEATEEEILEEETPF